MTYLTELHCHTGEISDCGLLSAADTVEKYIAADYDTLTITNHFNHHTFRDGKYHKYTGRADCWNEMVDFFFSGIELVEKHAGGRINITWGLELRCDFDNNDYLVYGVDRDFVYSNQDLMLLPIKKMSERIHQAGGLIYQAHPFRNGIKVVNPQLIDGIEAYNGHVGHDSRNDIALQWAHKFGLNRISGSDLHKESHFPTGGILTKYPITNNEELLNVLKSNDYTPLRLGEDPSADKKQ